VSGGPGLIIIQLDGLSYPRLRDGIARGLLPTLGRWLREETHRLHPLDSGLPSQTSSAQATLLYGVPDPPPGFRWFDRAAGRARTSRSPADLRRAARAWPSSAGLLQRGTAITTAWPASAAFHTLVLSEGLRGSNLRCAPWRAALRSPWPHGTRGASPAAILRGLIVAGALDTLTLAAAVKAIHAGQRPVFATLLGYDQVAHHAGLDAPMTAWALGRLDAALLAIEGANSGRDGRAAVVVFADHGLSDCAAFQTIRGVPLRAMIARATRTPQRAWHVAPSGNLAHVYSLSAAAHATLGPLAAFLASDKTIAFVVHAGVAHGPHGSVDLDSGATAGRNPLAPYDAPELRRTQLGRLACHADAGDLMVMGAEDSSGRVLAFEAQRAAHGGLGGAQTEAFAVLPDSFAVPERLNLASLRLLLLANMGC
jgi:hypothetical protein